MNPLQSAIDPVCNMKIDREAALSAVFALAMTHLILRKDYPLDVLAQRL